MQIEYDDLIDVTARAFHATYETLAPTFGWSTQEASRKEWDDVPERNRNLMRATIGQLIRDGVIEVGPAAVAAVSTTPEDAP